MGVLKTLPAAKSGLHRLPSGAFTVDSQGNLVSSTVPQWVPEALILQIGWHILAVFKGAAAVRLPFSELRLRYAAFNISAREMRGGAIIFLSPKTARLPPSSS
jgi:hypothetical protein